MTILGVDRIIYPYSISTSSLIDRLFFIAIKTKTNINIVVYVTIKKNMYILILCGNQEQGSLGCIQYSLPLSIQLKWRCFNAISIYRVKHLVGSQHKQETHSKLEYF